IWYILPSVSISTWSRPAKYSGSEPMFFARSSTSTYWPCGECVSHSSSTSLTPSSTLRTVNSQAPWATASPTRYDSSTSAGCSAVSSRDSSAVSSRDSSAVSSRDSDDGATSARQPTATNSTTRSVAHPPHPTRVTLAPVDMPWRGGCDGGCWYGGCMRSSNRN